MTTKRYTPNLPLLNEALDYIRAHPEEWEQEAWICGTAACIGGRAALLAGEPAALAFAGNAEPDDAFGGLMEAIVRATGLPLGHPLFAAENRLKDLERHLRNLEREYIHCLP